MPHMHRRPRNCEVCHRQYQPSYYEQRTCGRACGVELRRAVGTLPPHASPVLWRQCALCGSPYTTRGGRRCGCGKYRPISGERTITCRACAQPFRHMVVTRPATYCSECRAANLAAQRRNQRKLRKARQRGVQVEPVNVQRVYERDRWRCGLCRRRVNPSLAYPHPMSASLDHVIPLAHGGEHGMANVQLAHLRCNRDKRDGGTQQLALIG